MPTVRTRLRVTEGEMVQITKRIPPGTWSATLLVLDGLI